MNLVDYEQKINSVKDSNLPSPEKAAALELIKDEIERILWQPHAKTKSAKLAAQCCGFGEFTLDGLDELARKGLLKDA